MHPIITQACADNDWSIEGNRITVKLDEERSQVVIVQEYEAKGHALLRVYSHLGDAASVDERRVRAALRLNWTLPFGAVAIAEIDDPSVKHVEHLVLCDAMLESNLTAERCKTVVEFIASNADNYERFVFGTDDY